MSGHFVNMSPSCIPTVDELSWLDECVERDIDRVVHGRLSLGDGRCFVEVPDHVIRQKRPVADTSWLITKTLRPAEPAPNPPVKAPVRTPYSQATHALRAAAALRERVRLNEAQRKRQERERKPQMVAREPVRFNASAYRYAEDDYLFRLRTCPICGETRTDADAPRHEQSARCQSKAYAQAVIAALDK